MDYDQLVQHLAMRVVGILSSVDVDQIVIHANEHDSAAHLEICLRDDSWSSRSKAIEALVGLRVEMLEEGISYSYGFRPAEDPFAADEADLSAVSTHGAERVLVLAD